MGGQACPGVGARAPAPGRSKLLLARSGRRPRLIGTGVVLQLQVDVFLGNREARHELGFTTHCHRIRVGIRAAGAV